MTDLMLMSGGPRSKRLLLGPGHSGGGKPPSGGCALTLLLVVPTLVALTGWVGGWLLTAVVS